MKRKIVVNDIAASSGGALTVLLEFYEAVKRCTADAEWIFILSEKYIEETEKIKVVLLPKVKRHINRLVFEYCSGAKIINRYKPDVYFSLQNTTIRGCIGKTITYVHQSLPFQDKKTYSYFKRDEFDMAVIQKILGRVIKQSIKKSDLVIVQTKWMEKAVKQECKVQNVLQIYPAFPNVPYKAEYRNTNTFFYPTSNAAYKNNDVLLQAQKHLNNEGINTKVILTNDGCIDEKNIEFIGRIEKDEVYKYYSKSCLVFPSYIETFGYPLVEARMEGSIILASDTEFSHELLEDYVNAYFFDPFNSDELYELMKKVANGEIERKQEVALPAMLQNESNSWDRLVSTIVSF